MEYQSLYLKHAVRKEAALNTTVPSLLEEFTFPTNSIMHYIDVATAYGPDATHPLLSKHEGKIYVDHIDESDTIRGSSKRLTLDGKKLAIQYHRRFLRFDKLRQMSSATNNKNNLIIENYAPIVSHNRYRRTVFSIYDEYYNIISTMISRLVEADYFGDSTNHWIPLAIPETLPDLESLKKNLDDVRRDDLGDYHEMADIVVLELYRFIMSGEESDASSLFDRISEEQMRRVNFVWTESGSWSWFNLGDLNDWRNGSGKTETAKRLLALLDRMLEERTEIGLADEDGFVSEATLDAPIDETDDERLSRPIIERANEMVEAGRMSGQEFKRMSALATRYTTIPAPDGEGTLQDYMQIDPKVLSVDSVRMPDMESVVDKKMLKSTLMDFEKRYIGEVMGKDVVNFSMSLQGAGFAVLDIKRNRDVDYANDLEEYSIKVQPADGKVSTIKFTLPRVQQDGTYKANGVKYRMAIQPGDLPIRKVLAGRVALTSYYGKNFVSRSERTVHDYGNWLAKRLIAAGMEKESIIHNVHFGDYYKKSYVVPRVYSGISMRMSGFEAKGFTFNFDYAKADEFSPNNLADYKKDGTIVIAKNREGVKLLLDDTGIMFKRTTKGTMAAIGMMEEFLDFDGRPPVDMAELGIMGKTIPVGIVLGYHLGLNGLLKKLKVKARWVPRGKRVEHSNDEFVIVFKDETLILSRTSPLSSIIMSGFNMYRNQIRDYNSHELNKPDAYRRLLNSVGLTAQRYGKELDLMNDMFIDHVTLSILRDMKEPTNLVDLYIRACDMLTKDEHPEEVDPEFMRYRGYERVGGMVYAELVRSVRQYRRMPGGKDKKLSLHPKAVWMNIAKDASNSLVEEINPIVELKQQELVTFSGSGGRSAQSMTAKARVYSKNNVGTISESGVDSGKVGINTYLSSDPKFSDVRGRTERYDKDEDSMVRVMSTSANLAPFSDRADGKRISFISIQQGSSLGSVGYRPMPISTGMDKVIAQRASSYAYTAPFDGSVKSVEDEYLTVTSKDGKDEHVIYIGTHFGVVSGTHVPQRIICDVKSGHKFKKGDVLAFNEAFFERDSFDVNQVQYKMGFIVPTTFLESADTLEDSSAIHKSLADKMAMELTTLNTVSVDFDAVVGELVKEGTKLSVNDILCTLTDEASSDGSDRFDAASLDILDGYSATTPKTKTAGLVERIEVVYYGDKENMSDSLRKIVNASDKRLAEIAKRTGDGSRPTSGRVSTPIRVGGVPLVENSAIIKIFVTKKYRTGSGSKGVFSNQLKTVYGSVYNGNNRTLSGIPILAKFAYQSLANRILLDADIWGTGNMLLLVKSKQVYKTYRGIK